MRLKILPCALVFSVVVLVTGVVLPERAQARPAELHPEFKIPESGRLREKVDFWIQIYGKIGSREGLLHDSKFPTLIYEKLDFSAGNRGAITRKAKERTRKVLLSLHASGVEQDPSRYASLSSEERRIHDLFKNILEPGKFLKAAHYRRLRMQVGQKDQFLAGMKMAGRYLPYMEEVIIQKGIPFEISRLPYVESSFNTRARSKVGASGIWQFMKSTGSEFLMINDAVDERNDPIRASEAAAALMKINYGSLGSWPLAVTAYNHGRKSLMRAVRRYGTLSLEDLFEVNKWRNFGFASSNFFACLLAAIEIDRNPELFFGKVDRERSERFVEIPLTEGIQLKNLLRFLSLDSRRIEALNPALTEEALRSRVPIPAGYQLRVPHSGDGTLAALAAQRRIFMAGFRKIPKTYKTGGSAGGGVPKAPEN